MILFTSFRRLPVTSTGCEQGGLGEKNGSLCVTSSDCSTSVPECVASSSETAIVPGVLDFDEVVADEEDIDGDGELSDNELGEKSEMSMSSDVMVLVEPLC